MSGVPSDTYCAANLCKPREAVAVHQSRSVPLLPEALGLVGRVGIPRAGGFTGIVWLWFQQILFHEALGLFYSTHSHPSYPVLAPVMCPSQQ